MYYYALLKFKEESSRPKLMRKTWGVNGEIKGTLKTKVGMSNIQYWIEREKRIERERDRETEREKESGE